MSVAPEDVWAFESILEERATRLGEVTDDGALRALHGGRTALRVSTTVLRQAWNNGLVNETIGVFSEPMHGPN